MWKDKIRFLRDYIVKHSKIVFPIVVIAAVAGTVTVVLNSGDSKGPDFLETETADTESTVEVAMTQVEEEVPLVLNEDGAISSLIATYYNAMALGDSDTLYSICDEISEQDMLRNVETSKYIDCYPVLETYTKQGPEAGSTIAYVYYKVVFTNHEEQFPGYKTHYICTNEEGQLYLKRSANSEEVDAYIQRVTSQNDVIEFNNRITVEYNELMESKPELWEYLNELDTAVSMAVGEVLAEQVAEETVAENQTDVTTETEVADSGTEGEDASQTTPEETEAPAEPAVQYAKATTTVNVRMSDSEQAEKMGKATEGTTLQVVEVMVNGWTKVIYERKEGYIKSEFLEMLESAEGATVIGSVTATTNINVRAEASETAERLGVLAGGDTAELLAKENGWCKIKYDGRVGYVKADYVQ